MLPALPRPTRPRIEADIPDAGRLAQSRIEPRRTAPGNGERARIEAGGRAGQRIKPPGSKRAREARPIRSHLIHNNNGLYVNHFAGRAMPQRDASCLDRTCDASARHAVSGHAVSGQDVRCLSETCGVWTRDAWTGRAVSQRDTPRLDSTREASAGYATPRQHTRGLSGLRHA